MTKIIKYLKKKDREMRQRLAEIARNKMQEIRRNRKEE